jgi:hemerythrin-like domain-containing protein
MRKNPPRQLPDEHEYVKLVVGAMDAEVAYIERSGRVHTDRVAQMVDFTRSFTDGDHHAKEEELLFPLREERSSAAGGTMSVLLSEHEAAREHCHKPARMLAQPPADD